MENSLPIEIEQAVNIAFDAMQAHSQHLLIPIYRYAIYDSINKTKDLDAHSVKVSLNLLTVQYVLSYWKMPLFMYSKEDDEYDLWQRMPHHMVEISRGVINGTIEKNKAIAKAAHWQEVTDLTGQLHDSPYYNEWCVFDAGLRCLWQTLDVEIELNREIDINTKDEDLYGDSDVAKWACFAYVGGTWIPNNPIQWNYDEQQRRWITDNKDWYFEDNGIWDRNTKTAINRRRKFWDWWLTQAISKACQQSI